MDSFDPNKPSPLFAPFRSTTKDSGTVASKTFLLSPFVATKLSDRKVSSITCLASSPQDSASVGVPFDLIRTTYDILFH